MGILEPEDIYDALLPIFYVNLAIGLGVFQPARSTRVRVIMILYTVGFWVLYVITFYIGIKEMVPSYLQEISPMAVIMYQVLVYTNTSVSLMAPFLGLMRRKGLSDSINRMQKVDDTIERLLGIEKFYKKIVVEQIYQIVTVCFIMLAITVSDSLWLQGNTSVFTKFAIMLTFHLPILLMLVTDLIFCGSTRSIGKKFQQLNKSLLRLAEPDAASHPRGRLMFVEQKITKLSSIHGVVKDTATNLMSKRHFFQTIRKTHLELSKIAGNMNSVFGIQNLISMGVSSVMITGLLYTIYSAFYWKNTVNETIREVLPPICWCIIYVSKVFLIVHTCATVSNEAKKSGEIIYEILGSTSDKEFQKEIQEFALQMIQNPVRFTACGFFTLDYTYVQGVIGSITTYLVILIQMSDASSFASATSYNKSAT